jgi:cyclohexanone monooxygenase
LPSSGRLGGLAAAVKLRQRTAADFVIFEQSAGIGGTWRDNRYPGCEVDIHSHTYSFSFLKYEWPRMHATQPELLAYAEHVVKVFGLAACLRLSTKVTSLVWEESAARYALTTDDGERHEFDVVISAAGLLSVPRYPDWPGLASFAGVCFHTAVGAGARPERQDRGRRRHRVDGGAGRARDSAAGRPALRLPAGARLARA